MAMGSGYGMRSLTDALFREAGFRPRIAFESQDSHTVRGLVSAGLGVSILPPGGSAPGGRQQHPRRHRSRRRRPGLGGDSAGFGPGVPRDRPRLAGAAAEAGPMPSPIRCGCSANSCSRDGPALLAGFVRERSGG